MRESVALGRMTLALTLALCKTRKYPLCTPRGAGVGHWCEVLTLRVTVDIKYTLLELKAYATLEIE